MITLTLTPLQHDIIKAAVANYAANLLETVQPEMAETVTLSLVSPPVSVPDAPRKTRRPRKALRTRKAKAVNVEAPWGYKKDGTPRARPGRKAA